MQAPQSLKVIFDGTLPWNYPWDPESNSPEGPIDELKGLLEQKLGATFQVVGICLPKNGLMEVEVETITGTGQDLLNLINKASQGIEIAEKSIPRATSFELA